MSEADSDAIITAMKRIAMLSMIAFAAPQSAHADVTFDSLSMDRLTPVTTLAFDFGYEVWDDTATTELKVMSINLAGHFVNRRGVGGYLTIPLSYIDARIGPFEDTELALGNLEVGGLLARHFGSTALLFHGGLVLGTSSDDGAADFMGLASFTRFGDFVHRIQNSTWLRLGMSPMGRVGSLFWRADAGIDLALDEDNAIEYSPVIHLNVGGGIDLGGAQILAELVNVFANPDDESDDTGSTFTIGARFASGDLRPGIGLLLPIDLPFEDFEFALLASLAVHVRGSR